MNFNIIFTRVLIVTSLLGGLEMARGQGTAFTYQGRLNDGGTPANGSYDFRFRLASDPLANNYVGGNALTNGVAAANIVSGSIHLTLINDPVCNGVPNAMLIVAPNWNAGGGVYDNHAIGVFYNGAQWGIFNQDFAAMPTNAAFNVLAIKP